MIISFKTCYMQHISWIVLLLHHFYTLLDPLFSFTIITLLIWFQLFFLSYCYFLVAYFLSLCIWCSIGILFTLHLFFKNYVFMCFCPASQLNFNFQRQNYFYFILSFSLVPSVCKVCFKTSNTYWIFNLHISSVSHD